MNINEDGVILYKQMSEWYGSVRGFHLYNPFIAYKFKNSAIKTAILSVLIQQDLIRHNYVYADIDGGIESSPALSKIRHLNELLRKHGPEYPADFNLEPQLSNQAQTLADYNLKAVVFNHDVEEYASILNNTRHVVSAQKNPYRSIALIDVSKIPFINVRGIRESGKNLEMLPYDQYNRLYFFDENVVLSKDSIFKTKELRNKSFSMMCYHMPYCGFIPNNILENIYDSNSRPQKFTFNFNSFEDSYQIAKLASFGRFTECFFDWIVETNLLAEIDNYVQGMSIPDYIQHILLLNAAETLTKPELDTYKQKLERDFDALALINYDTSVLHTVMCSSSTIDSIQPQTDSLDIVF